MAELLLQGQTDKHRGGNTAAQHQEDVHYVKRFSKRNEDLLISSTIYYFNLPLVPSGVFCQDMPALLISLSHYFITTQQRAEQHYR